ncbi:beta clamp domain-containing protein [Phaeacidiphilus oryzae]|uniref:hypothetical protein n=1 Tax=Phaeacidiphilus oryzae TaxID=348818 RepID=UPI00056C0C60|nr:hypothetical protein [Phaeacidiphilus oryzae]
MLPIHDLNALLAQVAPHMYTDAYDLLPPLNGVLLETDASHLYAVATDRYSFAIARTRPARERGAIPAAQRWRALLSPADLRALRTMRPLAAEEPAELDYRPGRQLEIRIGEQTLRTADRSEKAERFPNWRSLLAQTLEREPELPDDLALNPTYLARWSKGIPRQDRYVPLTVWATGAGKPIVFARGEDFIGLQMPVTREPSDDQPTGREAVRHAWAADATAAEPHRAAA